MWKRLVVLAVVVVAASPAALAKPSLQDLLDRFASFTEKAASFPAQQGSLTTEVRQINRSGWQVTQSSHDLGETDHSYRWQMSWTNIKSLSIRNEGVAILFVGSIKPTKGWKKSGESWDEFNSKTSPIAFGTRDDAVKARKMIVEICTRLRHKVTIE